jgi:CBS domain-containing protein
MHLENYIVNDLETLLPSDLISVAKNKAKNQRVSHFPVVENKRLYGCISESDLSTFEEKSKKVSDYQYLFELFYATEEDTLVDLLTLFAVHETNSIPVLNEEKEYLGCFDLNDILTIYAETPFLKEEGILLVLEKDNNSYSISEIAQISETNNTQLFGIYVSKKTETTTQITIKIKTENINEIIQTYRRYEYNVISNHEDDSYLEDLKNRSNYLQKYLSI